MATCAHAVQDPQDPFCSSFLDWIALLVQQCTAVPPSHVKAHPDFLPPIKGRLSLRSLVGGPLRNAVCGLISTGCLTLGVATASANTVIHGDVDTNAPLVIDPSSSPSDPQTLEIQHGGSPTVGFVQSMPVTKSVSRVTIGDIGRGAGCPSSTGVRLLVNKHATGDLNDAAQIRNSGLYVPVPASPGPLSFNIQPALFKKGEGYSFQLVPNALCPLARTTWAHNAPTLNGGSVRCAAGPPAPLGGRSIGVRMWHQAGLADRISQCVSRSESWAFDPSMPTGWLVPDPAERWIATGTFRDPQVPGPTDDASNCGTNHAAHGAKLVYWRPHPTSIGYSQYVCMWPQYEPLDQRVNDGWYYGIPWKNDGSGAPRDTYIKLETIDYDALIARHAPVILYDSAEEFRVLSPGAMTDFYDETSLLQDDSNALLDSATFGIADQRHVGQPPGYLSRLSLDFLSATYADPVETNGRREATDAEAADHVRARGDASDDLYDDDSDAMFGRDQYANRVYVRVAHGADSRVWVQYWLFYYFNSLVPVHEGDWELVQVGLNEVTHAPERAVYAQHGGGEWCPWTSVQKVGDQPVVYVARHSHASYFEPVLEGGTDVADGQGGPAPVLRTEEIRATSPSWVSWPGKWGDSDTSPAGPGHGGNTDRWDYPGVWSDEITPCA